VDAGGRGSLDAVEGGSSSVDPLRLRNIRLNLALSFSTNSETESLRRCSVARLMGEEGLVGSVE
jgi:hypothetical protein